MQFNLTLIGQSVAFALFVWFCVKIVWPPVIAALRQRQQQIADGLAAAERGEQALARAETERSNMLAEARDRAQHIVEQAQQRGEQLIEEARNKAHVEGQRKVAAAETEIEQAGHQLRESLRKQLGQLVVKGAEQVVEREIDAESHKKLLAELAKEL